MVQDVGNMYRSPVCIVCCVGSEWFPELQGEGLEPGKTKGNGIGTRDSQPSALIIFHIGSG